MPSILTGLKPQAFGLGVLSLALCLFTPKSVTKRVPGSLLALFVGTVLASTLGLGTCQGLWAEKQVAVYTTINLHENLSCGLVVSSILCQPRDEPVVMFAVLRLVHRGKANMLATREVGCTASPCNCLMLWMEPVL